MLRMSESSWYDILFLLKLRVCCATIVVPLFVVFQELAHSMTRCLLPMNMALAYQRVELARADRLAC